MLIRYGSDYHLEFGPLAKDPEPADVLILAGDIDVKARMGWINEQGKRFGAVIYVPGNHEYYRGSLDTTFRKMKEAAAPNVHVLNNSSVEINGQWFHGSTMWTDVNKYDPLIAMQVGQSLNDFHVIRYGGAAGYERPFNIHLWQRLNRAAVEWLANEIKPGSVVITHHAPHKKTDVERYGANNPVNHLYGSDMTRIIDELKPAVWHHGHLHESFDFMVADTRILANPRGYVGHGKSGGENPDFNVDASYEI